MKTSTKANTLKILKNNENPQIFRVLPQLAFTADELLKNQKHVEQAVKEQFSCPLIVRSSALDEDTQNLSNAGQYLSLQNIMPNNVCEAAKEVMASYKTQNPENQVLIQPMLNAITLSGVLFTADPNTGGNYYTINYDCSGSSDSVTSGKDAALLMVFKGRRTASLRFDNLIVAADALCGILSQKFLDIEFAFSEDDIPYIFQARPLVMKKTLASFEMQSEALARAECLIQREMQQKPYAKGERTIYGIMPDWNPAEMIGVRPKPLSFSLYARLITDRNWAYQRDNYGYRNMRSYPLMLDFLGLPYIDTRVSFNSFIPKELDEALAEKLVNYYLNSLAANPNNHDKIEFEIVFSCYTFDIQKRAGVLLKNGFSRTEINDLLESLRHLTNKIINVQDGLWMIDMAKIQKLQERQKKIMSSDMDVISKIYWLLEDCGRYGTLPFAGLARAGFIAVQLLKSLIAEGILSLSDYEKYMRGLFTVSSQISKDKAEMSKSAFLSKYGHLRPGTYDITSLRYDAAPDLYFSNSEINETFSEQMKESIFSLTLNQYSAIKDELIMHGLGDDPLALFNFIKVGIEGREHCKFVFSKSVSDAIELIAALGESEGFSREEMSYMDYSIINNLFFSADNAKELIARSIEIGRKKYENALQLVMPPVIQSPNDIYVFELPSGSPNFITMSQVTGLVAYKNYDRETLSGHILLVEAADPGFDWVFSCGVAGIITAYGGANSHMAIRAGELGIPAVIGAGEKLFSKWKNAKTLHIDCANKKVEVLK
jgi:phosphohistidine swiveling domain-containing protein